MISYRFRKRGDHWMYQWSHRVLTGSKWKDGALIERHNEGWRELGKDSFPSSPTRIGAARVSLSEALKAEKEALGWDPRSWWSNPSRRDSSLTEDQANRVWDVLVDTCGADEHQRGNFVSTDFYQEYRFCGSLGFGGKVYSSANGLKVSCYSEDRTSARDLMVARANQELQKLFLEFLGQ